MPAHSEDNEHVDLCLLVNRGDCAAVEACVRETPSLLHRVRWSGVGPLHRAVAKCDHTMVSLLLQLGAHVNDRAAWGWYTPLHLACKAGDERMIWLLLDHGAQWKLTDKTKKTPLQWAVKAGKASVAYRVDQQLHAKAKAAAAAELEKTLGAKQVGVSFTSLCS